MSKAKAKLDAEGFEYWILTNGKNSVVFRLGKQSQSNVIHIDGWPHGNESRNGTWQTRQATNMWNELIRIGYWVETQQTGNVTINGKPSSVAEVAKRLKSMMAE
jgi:hypothetical protein